MTMIGNAIDHHLSPGTRTGLARTALVKERLINHVVLVLDASGSMSPHKQAVREQVRQLVADLAEQSKVMDQETRLTIYQFDDTVECLAFDTDVLRLTDIHHSYSVTGGMTALHDATAIGLDDLSTTSALYGDHAFLVYVITDGHENASQRYLHDVARRMERLPENWTVAAFVPDVMGARKARDDMGFPADNVAMWNVNSTKGFEAAGSIMRTATSHYMTARSTGQRGTRTLFSTGSDAVNDATVKAAATAGDLQEIASGKFAVFQNGPDRLDMTDFIAQQNLVYRNGSCFYEFFKTEHIQPQKQIVIREKKTGKVFTDPTYGSPAVRAILGLTQNYTAKVKPDANDKYEIFVQSTAGNRKVIPGKRVLVLR